MPVCVCACLWERREGETTHTWAPMQLMVNLFEVVWQFLPILLWGLSIKAKDGLWVGRLAEGTRSPSSHKPGRHRESMDLALWSIPPPPLQASLFPFSSEENKEDALPDCLERGRKEHFWGMRAWVHSKLLRPPEFIFQPYHSWLCTFGDATSCSLCLSFHVCQIDDPVFRELMSGCGTAWLAHRNAKPTTFW